MYIKTNTNHDADTYLRLTKNADYILLHFTDILGYLKGRTIPAEEVKKAFERGVTFDGSSMIGGTKIEDSDMIMQPDPSTFTVYPYYFYDKSVAGFICDIRQPEGEQFDGDSRYILRQAIEKISAQGYNPTAAAELEFYLVQRDKMGDVVPVENHLIDKQRYFDIAPGRDLTESYRMELSSALSTMGITVERQHHEAGSAQNEITFKYSNPLATADNIVRYKFAAKAVADKKYGWIATFMPKPWHGKAGSGMHIHLGLFRPGTGSNPFYDPNGYACISQDCQYFIGGILEHARSLCAITSPTINSYKRLVSGYEAPIYVAWSKKNRSALIRIPAFPSEDTKEARIEFRCPDALCNPYLTYAAVFEAGMEGIRKKTDPGEPVETNIYHLTENERKNLGVKLLPASLKEALDEWKCDDICMKAMGKEVGEKYIQLKTQEWREHKPYAAKDSSEVTKWEIQKYLYA